MTYSRGRTAILDEPRSAQMTTVNAAKLRTVNVLLIVVTAVVLLGGAVFGLVVWHNHNSAMNQCISESVGGVSHMTHDEAKKFCEDSQ